MPTMPICTNFATYTPNTDRPSKKSKVDFRPFWGCVVWGVPARPWGWYSRIGNCSWVLEKARVAFINQRALKFSDNPPAPLTINYDYMLHDHDRKKTPPFPLSIVP